MLDRKIAMYIVIGLTLYLGVSIYVIIAGIRKTHRPQRKQEETEIGNGEGRLKASGTHWLYCSDCERFWFTCRIYCRHCGSELEKPHPLILMEFTQELHDAWNELTDVTGEAYSENEVAGLLALKKRDRDVVWRKESND